MSVVVHHKGLSWFLLWHHWL